MTIREKSKNFYIIEQVQENFHIAMLHQWLTRIYEFENRKIYIENTRNSIEN